MTRFISILNNNLIPVIVPVIIISFGVSLIVPVYLNDYFFKCPVTKNMMNDTILLWGFISSYVILYPNG